MLQIAINKIKKPLIMIPINNIVTKMRLNKPLNKDKKENGNKFIQAK